MRFARLLLFAAPFAFAACASSVGPATDCVYDKTASAAPGNQLCTASSTIASDYTAGPSITITNMPQ
jgi:hypothetical protein